MYIEGCVDDFTEDDKNIGNVIAAKPIDVIYDVDFILDKCKNKNGIDDFLRITKFNNKESLINFLKKEYGYDSPE